MTNKKGANATKPVSYARIRALESQIKYLVERLKQSERLRSASLEREAALEAKLAAAIQDAEYFKEAYRRTLEGEQAALAAAQAYQLKRENEFEAWWETYRDSDDFYNVSNITGHLRSAWQAATAAQAAIGLQRENEQSAPTGMKPDSAMAGRK